MSVHYFINKIALHWKQEWSNSEQAIYKAWHDTCLESYFEAGSGVADKLRNQVAM